MTEQRDLMPRHDDAWLGGTIQPLEQRIHPLASEEARNMFLYRYNEIVRDLADIQARAA